MEPETTPDPRWVAHLARVEITDAERAVDEARERQQLFREIDREHRREGRASYVEIDAPFELFALVRLARPAHVVEVGVSSGVSSAYLLDALGQNGTGTLHSVDRPSYPRKRAAGARPARMSWTLPAGRSSGWAVPYRLRRRWDLRLGDKADVLPILAEELPSIDLFVYDVPHEDRGSRAEFRVLDPLFRSGSVAIVDHGVGGGRCAALAGWARDAGTVTFGREGSGLYGMRHPGTRDVGDPSVRSASGRLPLLTPTPRRRAPVLATVP